MVCLLTNLGLELKNKKQQWTNSITPTTVRGNITLTAFVCTHIRYSATGVVFATALPSVPVTEMKFEETAPKVTVGNKILLKLATTPAQTTSEIIFTSGTTENATVKKVDNKTVEVTGVKAGTSVITAKSGNVTGTVTVTVK